MIYLIFISIILLTLSDWLNWKYNKDSGIWLTELSKIALLGSIASIFATGFIGIERDHIIAWIFLRFPIHQVGCGLLRHGNPLYLGAGIFDRIIYFLAGKQKWFYIVLLLASLFVGLYILIR